MGVSRTLITPQCPTYQKNIKFQSLLGSDPFICGLSIRCCGALPRARSEPVQGCQNSAQITEEGSWTTAMRLSVDGGCPLPRLSSSVFFPSLSLSLFVALSFFAPLRSFLLFFSPLLFIYHFSLPLLSFVSLLFSSSIFLALLLSSSLCVSPLISDYFFFLIFSRILSFPLLIT